MVQHRWRCRLLSEDDLEGRSILTQVPGTPGPIVRGEGSRDSIDLLCGSCGRVLAKGIQTSLLTNVVLRCPCGAHNDTNLV